MPSAKESSPSLQEALRCLEEGNWQRAHEIVQDFKTPYAYWLHGIVHIMENDLENAQYWYTRAKRPFVNDASGEIAAARAMLEQG